ncbi:MAG: hypothetical protein ACJ0IB_02245 [Verrucomicrobiales bacterium]|jgi:hypothetical protein|nr:hypothetical protein [Verrucomicrobiales bacterium]OUU88650.1 MAG: hypothetical protein CBC36_04960 [Verrucomicrobiaceae bacterium TMED76]|tara:strand:- start:151 stop:618 length:468 start_codon:yes stop_codon:yes gene_type:complete
MLILNIKDLKSLIKFAGLALLTLSLSNCSILDQNPKPGLVEPSAAVPGDFLFSWHKPYNKWMDTPVRVYYNDVSLEEIFENDPLTGLSYKFVKSPETMPLVSMDSMGITRRQLLWAIAHENNLHMSLRSLPNGQPSQILIRYRGAGTETSGKDEV